MHLFIHLFQSDLFVAQHLADENSTLMAGGPVKSREDTC